MVARFLHYGFGGNFGVAVVPTVKGVTGLGKNCQGAVGCIVSYLTVGYLSAFHYTAVCVEGHLIGICRPVCSIGKVTCGHCGNGFGVPLKSIAGLYRNGSFYLCTVVNGASGISLTVCTTDAQVPGDGVLITGVIVIHHVCTRVGFDGNGCSRRRRGKAFISIYIRRYLAVHIGGTAYGIKYGVTVTVHVLLIVIYSIGDLACFPLSCKGEVLSTHCCIVKDFRAVIPTIKAVACSCRCGQSDGFAVFCGYARRCYRTASSIKGDGIGITCVLIYYHQGAVCLNRHGLSRRSSKACVGLGRRRYICIGGACEVIGIGKGERAVKLLFIMLYLIGDTGLGNPLGVQGYVSTAALGDLGDSISVKGCVIIPTAEGITDLRCIA